MQPPMVSPTLSVGGDVEKGKSIPDAWVDGWMDGWRDGWMDGEAQEQMGH